LTLKEYEPPKGFLLSFSEKPLYDMATQSHTSKRQEKHSSVFPKRKGEMNGEIANEVLRSKLNVDRRKTFIS